MLTMVTGALTLHLSACVRSSNKNYFGMVTLKDIFHHTSLQRLALNWAKLLEVTSCPNLPAIGYILIFFGV